ncbi:MAG: GNAT family N-acetyltransferase [Deltaproteobacteria bacterium]|nr:GNAT family N-acetyltransferase [Deltaproteobacteria bacterium]
MSPHSQNYEVFIKGENIDLVIPNERAIEKDGWHSWFNDPEVTRYLKYGLFPNTPAEQRQRLQKIQGSDDGLYLLVLPKDAEKVTGIAHIAGIDWKCRSGHFGLVMGGRGRGAGTIFESLEAKARMVEHAFEVIGLERIWGRQVVELEIWQRYQILFGFKPEGIQRNSFRRGQKYYDEVITSCLLDDYLKLKEARQGHYWPGREKVYELMRSLPDYSLVHKVAATIQETIKNYLDSVQWG